MRPASLVFNALVVSACLLLSHFAVGACWAQDTITFDVKNRTINRVLPFGEPFEVAITEVDALATRLTVRVHLTRSARGEGRPACSSPSGWYVSEEAWRAHETGWRVRIPPLQADRYVIACLVTARPPTPQEASSLEGAMIGAIDLVLRDAADLDEGFTARQARDLQRSFLRAARSLPGVDSVAPRVGSALDTLSTSSRERLEARVDLARFVRSARTSPGDQVRNLENAQSEARSAVEAAASLAKLSTKVDRLRDAKLPDFVEVVQGLILLTASAPARRWVATGAVPLSATPSSPEIVDLAFVREARTLDGVKRNIDSTLARLTRVQTALESPQRRDQLTAILDASELQLLGEHVTRLRDAISSLEAGTAQLQEGLRQRREAIKILRGLN